MSLKIIRCGLTAMNSDIYINEMVDCAAKNPDKNLILLVPDRFSYIAEKLVCRNLGGIGFGGAQVYTLHRLVRKYGNKNKMLTSEGKQILLQRIINETISETSVFAGSVDKTGFVRSVLDIMDNWNRFCIDTEEFSSELDKFPEGITKAKLEDLKDIYCVYKNEFSVNGYTDETEMLFTAAELIKSDSLYSDSVIWIDGFVEFTSAELGVIDAFIKSGADVRIYLPCKRSGSVEHDDVYFIPQQTFINLRKMCEKMGYQYSVSMAESDKAMAEEIAFLCDTYDNREEVYNGECNAVVLKQTDDVYTEVEYAASLILDLVCSKNINFSDISVLCGNLNTYNSCIEAVFNRYSIPYFTDYKVPLAGHSVAVLLTSVFDILENRSFAKTDVLRYLKTGYVIKNTDDCDLLAYFAEKRGIMGGMWFDDKYFEAVPDGFFDEALGKEARINRYAQKLKNLRHKAVQPLIDYYEASKGKKTATEHISLFFEFIKDINLFKEIEESINLFESNGDENEASRLARVWNILIRLLEQLAIASGDEKISRSKFAEYFKAGIEGAEISIIPTVTNGVSVSDAGHRNGSEVKALFILGATSETVPAVKTDDGIITEEETASIQSLPSGTGKRIRNLSKEFELLTAFSETSELLYISCCKVGNANEKERRSPVFDLLLNKFPGLEVDSISPSDFVSSPETTLHKLLVTIASDKELSARDKAAYEWFSENTSNSDSFGLLEEAEKYKELTGRIPKNISAELYKNLTKYSVSRLEKYFSCPFMYFLTYGLRLDDGEEYGMKSADTGSFVHHAIALFCEKIEQGAVTPADKKALWNAVDKEYVNNLTDEIIAELKIKSGFEDDPKMENVFARLASTVRKAAAQVVLMMQNGNYTIAGNELEFDDFTLNGADYDVSFHGIIDRLDILEENGKTNIRIVDYKTGEKEFKFPNALNGIDMQLLVYAMAAESMMGENSEIAGFFYSSLKNKIITADDPKKYAADFSKLLRLSGTVVENAYDGEYEVKSGADMDCRLLIDKESVYLPLKLKKGDLYHSNSSVESPAFMAEVFRTVGDIAAKGAKNISDGDVRVYPYATGTKDSCKFCPYSAVCVYDKCNGAETNNGESGNKLYNEIKNNNLPGGEV